MNSLYNINNLYIILLILFCFQYDYTHRLSIDDVLELLDYQYSYDETLK